MVKRRIFAGIGSLGVLTPTIRSATSSSTGVARVECVAFDAFSYGLVEVDPEAGTATVTLKDEDGTELCQKVIQAE